MIRFLILAYGITWILVSPLVLNAWGILSGVPWWLHGLGAFGPTLAAYFSVRDRGIFTSAGPSRLSRSWIFLCLITPLIFALVTGVIVWGLGEPVLPPLIEAVRKPAWILNLMIGSLLYGFGEEPGWRGWLQPRLQQRHSPFVATLILTPVWAIWHVPFFVYRFHFEGIITIVGFFIGLLAGAFWLAFLYNRTRSVKVVALWHVLWNVVNMSLMEVSSTAVSILNGLMMVLGFSVAVVLVRDNGHVKKAS
ncbi:CPBP family intramembrane glutamic endopeptidase [Kaarinaea lacus]